MKKLLCDIQNTDDLIKIKQILNKANIDFEVSPKKSTLIQNFFNMFFYHVLSSGIDRKSEVLGIYVEEALFDAASSLVQKQFKEIP